MARIQNSNGPQKHKNHLKKLKEIVAKQTMLKYPDFSKTFHVHTDASDYQLGGVISQSQGPIAYFSKKLTETQKRYTIIGKELLSLTETLKAYRMILIGHKIICWTDHKNLTYPNTHISSDRIL